MGEEKEINKQDLDFEAKFLLILFFSENNHTLITRAIKLMFLFEEIFEIKGQRNLEFISSDYGPFAINFNLNITPLINEEIISYRETKFKEFSFNRLRKSEIVKLLDEVFINNEIVKDEINLIKKISKDYDHKHTNELIQLIYFLRPNYADVSEIKEEIIKIDKIYNQKRIINYFESFNKEYFLKLLNNFEGVLNLFNIDQTHIERKNFYNLIEKLHNPLHNESNLDLENLINIIDNISIVDSYKTYRLLKYRLLDFFSRIGDNKLNFKQYRAIIVFFFKSISLDWPLDKKSVLKFKKIYNNLKMSFNLKDFMKSLTPLKLDYPLFKEELNRVSEFKFHKIKDKIPEDFKNKNKNFSEIKRNGFETYNFVETIEEEYSSEEIEELEKSDEEYEKTVENY